MKKSFKNIYLCVIGALAVSAGPAGAVGGIADVTVYDRMENRTLPIYHHNGRYYVVGKPGNEYQIRVANRGRGEILSVVSVDGVNAVTGETANWEQTGYVLGQYQSFDIRGWRKSMDRIATFYFTEHRNSYAARTGRPNNVGVIGVALFNKKYEPPVHVTPPVRPWPRPYSRSDSSQAPQSPSYSESAPAGAPMDNARTEDSTAAQSSAPSAAERNAEGRATLGARGLDRDGIARAQPSTRLGTGHGRNEESHITYTNFERATSSPAEIITIHYDTYENLLAQGVIHRPPVYAQPVPTPFPGQFVPDPR